MLDVLHKLWFSLTGLLDVTVRVTVILTLSLVHYYLHTGRRSNLSLSFLSTRSDCNLWHLYAGLGQLAWRTCVWAEFSSFPKNGFEFLPVWVQGHGSAVGIATRLRAGWFGVRIPATARNFSLPRNIKTASGVHPASVKAAGKWKLPLISILSRG